MLQFLTGGCASAFAALLDVERAVPGRLRRRQFVVLVLVLMQAQHLRRSSWIGRSAKVLQLK